MADKLSLTQPRTPPGTVELLPRQQIAFQRFLDTIRAGYQRFGFLPVETPVFEVSSVLLTKEGGDTEKQVLFVQSSGSLKQGDAPDLALRFDLTVPLARYVAEHEHALNFPFRRYQIQKVYRGERPQRGRMREFYQCDIDVIGKDELALAYDAELPAVIHGIFSELAIGRFQIHLNNRRLLKGLLIAFGLEDAERQTLALREIDKLDKIGVDKVTAQLLAPQIGLGADTVARLLALMGDHSDNAATLARVAQLPSNPLLDQGRQELREVYDGARALGVPEDALCLDLTTVRGLDYYTGTVYETLLVDDPKLGSICSGGRYENLAGHYTKSKLPGVGISIGATRLFGQLMEKGVISAGATLVDALILQVEPALLPDYFRLAATLRQAGLNVEVYADAHKLGKQFKYADRAGAPIVVMMGGNEKSRGAVTLKHLATSEQQEVALADVAARIFAARRRA